MSYLFIFVTIHLRYKTMIDKLKIVYIPFLLAFVLLLGGYTFLHWLLLIKLEVFEVREVIVEFGAPFVLSALVAWIFLRQKFKVLTLSEKWIDFYTLISWAILFVTMFLAQGYMVTATGKLTHLSSISEINDTAATKYYTVEKFYIDKNKGGIHSDFEVTGRNNETFHMSIYIALPIFEKEEDTEMIDLAVPSAWFGIRYHKSISNRLEPEEKEKEYELFYKKSHLEFLSKDVSKFVYLDRISHSDDRVAYLKAMQNNIYNLPTGDILVGVDKPFEARNGSKKMWLLILTLGGAAILLAMILIPPINKKRLKEYKSGQMGQKRKNELTELLIPRGGFFITPILIYLNLGIYLLMAANGMGFLSFKSKDLLAWRANYAPLTTHGEWWRLLTSTFLHGGLMHVACNVFGLLFVGIFLEPVLGRVRYLLAYLFAGVLGSLASVWWYDASVSVGASGAIFGLYGVFLALLLLKVYHPEDSKFFLFTAGIFVVINLLMGLAGGVDNAAHIGGLLSGFVIGLILYPTLRGEERG